MVLPFIPTELWLKIGELLSTKDLKSLCLTSRWHYNTISEDLYKRGVKASEIWKCNSRTISVWKRNRCIKKNPALWAIKNNYLNSLSRLLDYGLKADVELLKKDRTPMFWGSIPRYTYCEPWSLLTFAIYCNRVEFVRLLLDKGADVNHQWDPDRIMSPLKFAVWNDFSNHANSETVNLLVQRGADVTYIERVRRCKRGVLMVNQLPGLSGAE